MSKKDPKTPHSQRLSTWLLRKPIKFAFMLLGLSILTGGVYAGLLGLLMPGVAANGIPAWPMTIIMAAVAVFCIFKFIKWLPGLNFDRHSFIALSGATLMSTCILLGLYILIASKIMVPMIIVMNSPVTQVGTALYVLVGLLAMAVISLYVLGLAIAMIYATYLRARELGVSKWRTILSLPFSILWIPCFILPDTEKKQSAHAIEIRPVWYAHLIERITANNIATWLLCILIATLFCIAYGVRVWVPLLALFTIYVIWHWIRGGEKMRNDIRGPFAIVAIIVNIIVIGYIGATFLRPTVNSGTPSEIEISESSATIDISDTGDIK